MLVATEDQANAIEIELDSLRDFEISAVSRLADGRCRFQIPLGKSSNLSLKEGQEIVQNTIARITEDDIPF